MPGKDGVLAAVAGEVAVAEVLAVGVGNGAVGPTPTPCPPLSTTIRKVPISAAAARTVKAIQSRRGCADGVRLNIAGRQTSVDAGASTTGITVDAGAETSLPRSLNQPTK